MAIVLADVRSLMVELLNMSTPDLAYGTISSQKIKSGEYDQMILDSDASYCAAFLMLKGDGRRSGFLTDSNDVAHGATLTSMLGPVETVKCVITGSGPRIGEHLVTPWPVSMFDELQRENRNPQGLTLIEPHCILDGNVIYHNKAGLVSAGATTAPFNVRFPQFTKTAACQSPDEARRAVALKSLAVLQVKDGVRVEAGGLFRAMAEEEMAARMRGAAA
jgi:hypothetical protein